MYYLMQTYICVCVTWLKTSASVWWQIMIFLHRDKYIILNIYVNISIVLTGRGKRAWISYDRRGQMVKANPLYTYLSLSLFNPPTYMYNIYLFFSRTLFALLIPINSPTTSYTYIPPLFYSLPLLFSLPIGLCVILHGMRRNEWEKNKEIVW